MSKKNITKSLKTGNDYVLGFTCVMGRKQKFSCLSVFNSYEFYSTIAWGFCFQ